MERPFLFGYLFAKFNFAWKFNNLLIYSNEKLIIRAQFVPYFIELPEKPEK